MHTKLVLLLFTALGYQVSNVECDCTQQQTTISNVFGGWPYKFDCSDDRFDDFVIEIYDGSDSDYIDDYIVQCVVRNSNTSMVLYNATFGFDPDDFYGVSSDALTPTSHYQVEITLKRIGANDTCYLTNVTFNLNATAPPSECSDSSNLSPESLNLFESKSILCYSDGQSYLPPSEYDIEWYKDCSPIANEASLGFRIVNATGVSAVLSTLHIDNVTYQHPGHYNCKIKYKGEERFFKGQRLCVQASLAQSSAILNCDAQRTLAKIGDDVSLKCTADFGTGYVNDAVLQGVVWTKHNYTFGDICINAKRNQTTISTQDEDIYCRYLIENPFSLSCLNQSTNKPARVTATLTIKNVSAEDFGNITVLLGSVATRANATIELAQVIEVPDLGLAVGLSVSLVVLAALLILIGWFFEWHIYARVLFKEKFGSYEKGGPAIIHEALIVYHYSAELDDYAKMMVNKSYDATTEKLQHLGYNYFDEHKERPEEGRPESTKLLVEQSHRCLIFPTPEFVRDDWNVRFLQEGVRNTINTGKKLIFILTPGMRAYIKQQSHHKVAADTYLMLRRALKINYVIDWGNDPNVAPKRLGLYLRDAMPKLVRAKANGAQLRSVSNGNHALTNGNGSSKQGKDNKSYENVRI